MGVDLATQFCLTNSPSRKTREAENGPVKFTRDYPKWGPNFPHISAFIQERFQLMKPEL